VDALNGIPTGLYTAQVYVWASRAKNSVPSQGNGHRLTLFAGASEPASERVYHPMPFSRAAVEAATTERFLLVP
jgi:hypothetical protein